VRKKAVDRSRPPENVPKHLLFRSLIAVPRPRTPLAFRVTCAAHIPLHVRALKSLEYSEVIEAADLVEIEQLTTSELTAGLVSACVYTPRGRAFGSAREVLGLGGEELAALGLEVLEAIHRVSPVYQRTDADAWRMALKEGAQHRSCFFEALSMYRSCDRVGMNAVAFERPDRYYGLPVRELVDGQLMAYSAAVELVSSIVRSPDE
jgi:hypothetical protein